MMERSSDDLEYLESEQKNNIEKQKESETLDKINMLQNL